MGETKGTLLEKQLTIIIFDYFVQKWLSTYAIGLLLIKV